jgi:hypothetical protein
VRRSLVILFLVAAFAPTSAMASDWYRCRMSGKAMQKCCCPVEKARAPQPQAAVRGACCCDVEHSVVRSADPRVRADAASVEMLVPPLPVRVLPRLELAERPQLVAASAVAQPRGPPVFLRNLTLIL